MSGSVLNECSGWMIYVHCGEALFLPMVYKTPPTKIDWGWGSE